MLNPTDTEKSSPVTVLFFDRFNVEDPLFVADVARRIAAAAKKDFRALIVHASHDAVERVREAYADHEGDPDEVNELVERAIRLTNQSITRRLIDEGVAAVSIQGCDRGLLRVGSDASIETGSTEWLERTIHLGGVPVVSLLALGDDTVVLPTDESLVIDAIVGTLAKGWSVTLVYFTTNRKSGLLGGDGARLETIAADELSAFEELPFPLRTGFRTGKATTVVVTNSAGLAPDGTVSGTRII